MKKIKLKELPIVSLHRGYSHIKEDGSIRRYYIPFDLIVAYQNKGVDPINILKKKIKQVERIEEDVELIEIKEEEWKYCKEENLSCSSSTNSFKSYKLDKLLMEKVDNALLKKLNKYKANSLIEFEEKIPSTTNIFYEKYLLFPLMRVVNTFHKKYSTPIINFLKKFQKTPSMIVYKRVYIVGARCYEEDLEGLVAKISEELLKVNFIIDGSLIEPSVIKLADLEGNNKNKYIVFFSPLIPMIYEDFLQETSLKEFIVPEGSEGVFIGEKKYKNNFLKDIYIDRMEII